MKFLLSSLVAASAIIVIYSERCFNTDNCALETCTNSTLTCVQGICTCVVSQKCSMMSDCTGLPPCERRGETWHCYDNMCKCIRFP